MPCLCLLFLSFGLFLRFFSLQFILGTLTLCYERSNVKDLFHHGYIRTWEGKRETNAILLVTVSYHFYCFICGHLLFCLFGELQPCIFGSLTNKMFMSDCVCPLHITHDTMQWVFPSYPSHLYWHVILCLIYKAGDR